MTTARTMIDSVILENFRSFLGRHEIALRNQGVVFVEGENRDEGGSNGAGKSTPFVALNWVLWDEVPRGGAVEEVVHEQVGRDCAVSVLLTDRQGPWTVQRYR